MTDADAARYRVLKQRFIGADFAWGDPSRCVLVFEMRVSERIGADLDVFCDAAIPHNKVEGVDGEVDYHDLSPDE